jgi:pSer/pThr/pTyr-binding forkhead associated (FHA) protein
VPLKGAVQLSGPGWEYTLTSDQVLLGRDPTCRVIVDDPLVSREHARLRIGEDQVVVEDLRSANGLYVNNIRIFEPCQLFDGDRILLGTTELCVFSAAARQAPSRPKSSVSGTRGSPVLTPAAPTERTAALDVLGRLADRMLADQNPQHAERILADHLSKLLSGARSGLPVPESVCTGAARHALKLARALGDGKWMNYAVELHLRAELPMAPEVVAELIYAAEVSRGIDHALYSVYVEWLRDNAARLGPSTARLIEALDEIKLPSR